jgi:hypothetical protein
MDPPDLSIGAKPRDVKIAFTFAMPTAVKGVAALVPTTGCHGKF